MSYKFHPSEYLTAMPYRYLSLIEYQDAHGQHFYNILFNETLQFAEAHVAFDLELIITYVIIVGVFAGSVYGIYYCLATKTVCFSSMARALLGFFFSTTSPCARLLATEAGQEAAAQEKERGEQQEGWCWSCQGVSCGPRKQRVAPGHARHAAAAEQEGQEELTRARLPHPQPHSTRPPGN